MFKVKLVNSALIKRWPFGIFLIDFLTKLGLVPLFLKKTNRKRLQSLIDGTLEIKTATITRTATGYTVSLTVQEVVAIPQPVDLAEDCRCVGIDLGLKSFAVVYDGKDFADYSNGAYIKQTEQKLAKLQQKMSRSQKVSKNYAKQRTKVVKLHEHITNQRKDFHHKLLTTLANVNQVVVVKDLNICRMAKIISWPKPSAMPGGGSSSPSWLTIWTGGVGSSSKSTDFSHPRSCVQPVAINMLS